MDRPNTLKSQTIPFEMRGIKIKFRPESQWGHESEANSLSILNPSQREYFNALDRAQLKEWSTILVYGHIYYDIDLHGEG